MRLIPLLCLCAPGFAFQSSRELNDLNWMEIRELVPARVSAVILPTGTLEPHGVANNGADNTAPLALARQVAAHVNALVAPILCNPRMKPPHPSI